MVAASAASAASAVGFFGEAHASAVSRVLMRALLLQTVDGSRAPQDTLIALSSSFLAEGLREYIEECGGPACSWSSSPSSPDGILITEDAFRSWLGGASSETAEATAASLQLSAAGEYSEPELEFLPLPSYGHFKLPALRELLVERKLPKTGNKKVLIRRLEEDDARRREEEAQQFVK